MKNGLLREAIGRGLDQAHWRSGEGYIRGGISDLITDVAYEVTQFLTKGGTNMNEEETKQFVGDGSVTTVTTSEQHPTLEERVMLLEEVIGDIVRDLGPVKAVIDGEGRPPAKPFGIEPTVTQRRRVAAK